MSPKGRPQGRTSPEARSAEGGQSHAATRDDVRLDAVMEVSFTQMVISSGLSEAELTELVRYGALVPSNPQAGTWTFESHWLIVARTASRLRRELDLDCYGVSIVLSYLDRIEALEAELRALRARLG